jgi:epoxide hydrolase-like predicted phosphatase
VAVFGNPVDIGSRVGGGFDTMSIHWMVVHKVRDLRARGYQVAICTNNIAAFRPTWQQQFPLEWFDDVIDSSEVGVRKPDEAIYLLACERLGRSPQQCVFVDDHPGNIAGAEAVGMAGVLVGENPWEALDALEAILTTRAPTGAARTAAGS